MRTLYIEFEWDRPIGLGSTFGDGHTDRQTHTHRHTHTDSFTHTNTHTHTHTHIYSSTQGHVWKAWICSPEEFLELCGKVEAVDRNCLLWWSGHLIEIAGTPPLFDQSCLFCAPIGAFFRWYLPFPCYTKDFTCRNFWFPEFTLKDLPLDRTATLVPGFAAKDLP